MSSKCINKSLIFELVKANDIDGAKKALSIFAELVGIENVPKEFSVLPRTFTMFLKTKEAKEFCKFLLDSLRLLQSLRSPDTADSTELETLDIIGKETAVDNPIETKNKVRRQNNWLHKAWGLYDLSRTKFLNSVERDFNEFVLTPFFDIKSSNSETINKSIKDFITMKINKLKEYLEVIGVDTTSILDPFTFGESNPQSVIDNILTTYRHLFYNPDGTLKLTSKELEAFENPTSKQYDQNIIQAYAAYLIIDPFHFDSYIKNFVKTIEIKNSFGILSPFDNKYGYRFGRGRENTSWQNEDSSYIVSLMVDDAVLMKIKGWNKYRKLGSILVALPSEFADLNSIINVFSNKVMCIPNVKAIRELPVYNKELDLVIKDMTEAFRDLFGFKVAKDGTRKYVIDEIISKYIDGKNISSIINSISQDYERLLPITFYLLVNDSLIFDNLKYDSDNRTKVYIDENDRINVYTIYKNMYDPFNSNSLLMLGEKYTDIYQMINLVFLTHEKKELFGIIESPDGVVKNYYSVGKANSRLNYLQSKLVGNYFPEKELKFPGTTIQPLLDEKKVLITIKPFSLEGISDEYMIEISEGNSIKFYINGVSKSTLYDNVAKKVLKDLAPFFTAALKLDFNSKDNQLYDIYKNLLGVDASYYSILRNLILLSARFIYGHEVSKKLSGLLTKEFKEKLLSYYSGTKDIKLASGLSYNLVDTFRTVYAIMSRLSMANDIHEGIAGNVIVKGGSGEQINSVVLSSLSTKFHAWFNEKSKDADGIPSAIKDFSIGKAIKRISFFRDYVNKKGDVKKSTSMSVEELFFASFVYDFYGEDYSNSLDSIYATTMGVFSDKPNLGRVEVYRHAEIFTGKYNELGLPIYKKIKDLSHSELKDIAIRELGIFYDRMHQEINRNLAILNKYSKLAQSTGHYEDFYSIDNDYKYTRPFSKTILKEDIHNAIVDALKAGENIEINDFLYFFWNKNELHAKHSIFEEINKNGVGSTDFFRRKEAEFVVNVLLDLKLGIRFVDNDGLIMNSQAIQNMRRKNPTQDSNDKTKEYWSTRDSIILAKLIYGDSIKNLVTKRDISKWSVYKKLHEFLREINPGIDVTKLNIDGDFDLLYFIDIINNPKINDSINNFFKLKAFRARAKELLKEKYSKQLKDKEITNKLKLLLIKQHQQYLIDNGVTDNEKLKLLVLKYIYEGDSARWKKRWIGFVTKNQINSIGNIAQLPKFIQTHELNNKELKDIIDGNYFLENTISLKINPEIQRYNTLGYLFSEETLNSTVGSSVNHEAKKYTENLSLLEAVESAALTKRNVAESGSKNLITRGDIRGMGKTFVVAIMEDLKASVSTVNGIEDKGAIKPMDGSTVGNYVSRKQEQFSQGSQKAGIDNSKPLGNDLNPKTGTGTIIKTAEFVLSNWRIRGSESNIRLHRIMNHILWNLEYNGEYRNLDGSEITFDGNYLEDYNGDKINYKPIIVYKPSTESYWLRTNISLTLGDNPGLTAFDEIEISDELLHLVEGLSNWIEQGSITPLNIEKLKSFGAKINPNVITSRPIRTNYELWDLFGGAYSAHIVNGQLVYGNDNTSLENLYIACTSVGRKLNQGKVGRLTEDDVWLPLKEAKIDWIITAGAIKQGACNINSTELINTDGYQVTILKINTSDIGMLQNPEHETDNSTVTLMSLVVNALGLKGFSADKANRVYEALGNLTNLSLKDLFDGIRLELTDEEQKLLGSSKLKNTMSSIILKSILGTVETGGDLLSSIVVQLKDAERNGQDFEIIKHKLPISDPYILNKIVSNIAATFTKMGIRIPFPGSMNVLVPSDGIYRLRGGKLLEIANTSRYVNEDPLIPTREINEEGRTILVDEETNVEDQKLKQLQEEANQNSITNISNITIGTSYYINILEGELDLNNQLSNNILAQKSIKIDDLSTYYELRDLLKGKKYTLIEDIKAGRELAPYNCIFNTASNETFMLWDLDSIRHIHIAENNPIKIEEIRENYSDEQIRDEFHIDPSQLDRSSAENFLKDFKVQIHRRKLIELNSIGSGNTGIVYINGERKKVLKGSTTVSPYELIASKNYATTFGLLIGDNLSEISKDRYFFLRRFINKQLLNPNSSDSNNYDFVLKTISGKNYYILYLTKDSLIPEELKPISDELFYNNLEWVGDKVYRLDDNGNRLYALPYDVVNGKTQYKAKIYIDSKGNEVIYTSDINNFINNLNYNNIEFSPRIIDSHPLDILKQIKQSKKISALKFYDSLIPKKENSLIIKGKYNEKDLKNLLTKVIENYHSNLIKLNVLLKAKESINIEDYTNPIIRQIIRSSIETHTSFLKSLDYIVSRTPAQSHLSFMPMKLVAFDESGKNSAYVSRYQLYLQGSDFDIDKASLLGSVIHNGKYITWSPFMSLSSIEHLKASETIPFPSGKELEIYNPKRIKLLQSKESLNSEEQTELNNLLEIENKFNNTRIYDKLDKPIDLIWENDRIIFSLPDYDGEIILYQLEQEDGSAIYITNFSQEEFNSLSKISLYILERAIVDKIPENARVISLLNLSHLGIINGVKNSELYLYQYDIILFNKIFSDLIEQDKIYYDNPYLLIQLATLINAYNSYGLAFNLEEDSVDNNFMLQIIKTVNKHNTYFNGKEIVKAKDSVMNFVGSNMFLISCDPVNLVQAMTSVDYLTEIIKGIANQSPLAKQATHFDKGNQVTTFRQARLTLSGKLNTGIEASSLKVYEAFNLYTDTVLNYGTQEELEELISKPLNIVGKKINLIANAYCKNIANIKTKMVYDILKSVDNDEDSALWLSAFLSLSTDNAKDPTLSKILANPETIGLYNAGFALGLPITLLTDVIMSPTASAIIDLISGNIFYGRLGLLNISSAINILERGLRFDYLDKNSLTLIKHVLKGVGVDISKINADNVFKYILPNSFGKTNLYKARLLTSIMKSKAFGDIEEIYNPLNLETECLNKLKSLKRLLNTSLINLETTRRVLEEKERLGRGHKWEDSKIDKYLIELENFERQIEQLEDIIQNLLEGSDIPNRVDGMYQWARDVKTSIEEINTIDMNLKNVKDYKILLSSIRTLRKFFLEMDSYLDMMEQIVYSEKIKGLDGKSYFALDIIKLLNEFAHEMSLIRPILGLNQQLPNSRENQLAFIRKFENIILERAGKSIKTESLDKLNSVNEKYGIDKNLVSIERFAFDENYRDLAIRAYGSIMYKINILDVLNKDKHYLGYLLTMAAYNYGIKKFSIQYRTLDKIAKIVIRGKMKINSKTEIEQYLKQSSKYISRVINNMFMLQKGILFSIPGKGLITLGTSEGNIAFKEWIDLTVIPKYKSIIPDNKFILSLDDLPYNKTDNRNTVINYTSGIDSMSQNESDRLIFSAVSLAFSDLSILRPESTSGLPLTDLFFYYDLISYDRQPSQRCLTPIFNNLIAGNGHQLSKEYVTYISDLDLNESSIITFDELTIDSICRFIAPTVSIYSISDLKLPYIFVKDPQDLKTKLLKRKLESSNINSELDDFIEDQWSDYNDLGMDELGEAFDDFGETSYSQFTLDSVLLQEDCKYELVSSDISSKRNPYLMNGALAYTEKELYSVLEGKIILTPTSIQLGNNFVKLTDSGDIEFENNKIEEYFKSLGITSDVLLNYRISVVDNNGNSSYKFNVADIINILENPCK